MFYIITSAHIAMTEKLFGFSLGVHYHTRAEDDTDYKPDNRIVRIHARNDDDVLLKSINTWIKIFDTEADFDTTMRRQIEDMLATEGIDTGDETPKVNGTACLLCKLRDKRGGACIMYNKWTDTYGNFVSDCNSVGSGYSDLSDGVDVAEGARRLIMDMINEWEDRGNTITVNMFNWKIRYLTPF